MADNSLFSLLPRLAVGRNPSHAVIDFINRQPRGVMNKKSVGSFFATMRHKLFAFCVNREIFNRIMAHLNQEGNCGYTFATEEEMDALTAELDTQALLAVIEQHASNMPRCYGKAFRHIMHRDLHTRLQMYEKIAKRRVRRTCDRRFVAEHA